MEQLTGAERDRLMFHMWRRYKMKLAETDDSGSELGTRFYSDDADDDPFMSCGRGIVQRVKE